VVRLCCVGVVQVVERNEKDLLTWTTKLKDVTDKHVAEAKEWGEEGDVPVAISDETLDGTVVPMDVEGGVAGTAVDGKEAEGEEEVAEQIEKELALDEANGWKEIRKYRSSLLQRAVDGKGFGNFNEELKRNINLIEELRNK